MWWHSTFNFQHCFDLNQCPPVSPINAGPLFCKTAQFGQHSACLYAPPSRNSRLRHQSSSPREFFRQEYNASSIGYAKSGRSSMAISSRSQGTLNCCIVTMKRVDSSFTAPQLVAWEKSRTSTTRMMTAKPDNPASGGIGGSIPCK